MNNTAIDPIWGLSNLTSFGEETADVWRTRPIASIKRQLHTFLRKQIEEWKPSLIVVVERKGTAILRALKEWDQDPLDWEWKRVISSAVVDQKPDEYFKGQRILVFDDMMKTGHHLRDLLNKFYQRGLWTPDDDNLRVAVFAIHEECSAGIPFLDKRLLHSWFYRDLTSSAYQQMRSQIVGMLQKSGSLMLDTEHIEVRIQLGGNLANFVRALGRKAKVQLFHSSAQRTNITVLYDDDAAHELQEDLFPEGTKFSSIVKKCRIVRRKGDEFAIIPICFPTIPQGASGWPSRPDLQELFGESVYTDDLSRYYAVGLLGALNVLRWVLKDLAILGPNSYRLSLPKGIGDISSRSGYDLEHLRVMYPTLNLDILNEWIRRIEFEARSEGGRVRAHKRQSSLPLIVEDEELYNDAIRLLQAIRYFLDQRIIEECWGDEPVEPRHPFGLRTKDIFDIGKTRFHWNEIRISTLFDILIDEALIEPHVEEITICSDRSEMVRTMVRTFEPDGEMVSGLIRRYTTQWGLPDGF